MKKSILMLYLFWCSATIFAQDYFPVNDGVKAKNTNYTAFTNAKIYITPTEVIQKGTLLIQNGKVVSVGVNVTLPQNTVVVDVSDKSIYPSFIDVYSKFGVEQPTRKPSGGRASQYEAEREGFYWNDHIMPENAAINSYKYDDKSAEELRKLGFGVVNSHIHDGIARGSGVLIALNSKATDANRILFR
jgi:hypothetical protein